MAGRGRDATLPAWMRGGGEPARRGNSRSRSPPRQRSPPRSSYNDEWRRRSPSPRGRGAGSEFSGELRASSSSSFSPGPLGGASLGGIDTKALIAAALANAAQASQSGIVNPATRQGREDPETKMISYVTPMQTAFFHELLASVYKPGDHLVGVYLHADKRFAFVEFKEVNVAAAAVALDGVFFNGAQLRIKRPNDYVPMSTQGPPVVFRLPGGGGGLVSTSVPDGPNKIFVGGLPHTLTDDQVKELLLAFGPLAGFHLVREPGSMTSKGYCFVEWADPSVGDVAIEGLHGMLIGDKALTCRRSQAAVATIERAVALGVPLPGVNAAAALAAAATAAPPATAAVGAAAAAAAASLGFGMLGPGIAGFAPRPPSPPPPPPLPANSIVTRGGGALGVTRLLRLSNMLTAAEAADPREYADITADVREELGSFGTLTAIVIPRAGPLVGNVYVEFAAESSAAAAAAAMGGRTFASRRVEASFEAPGFLAANAHLLR